MRLLRLVLIPAVVSAAVLALATPALATPPENTGTVGWAQDWHFTDANNWTFSMTIPGGAVVTGTGYDTEDVRYFTGTVTDTTPEPNLCSGLSYEEGGGEAEVIACDSTIPFSQFDPTPGDYLFELTVYSTDNGYIRVGQLMPIPTTKGYPALRSAGNGVNWAFVNPGQVNYAIVRPGAAVVGSANQGVPSRTTTAVIYGSTCTRTTVFAEYDVKLATASGCASSSPYSVTGSGFVHYFRVVNCLQVRVLGANPRCVEAYIR